MRISTQQVFLNNIDNISKTSADVFKTQQQLSTGKKVLQPSDDPLASAQIQKFKKEIARTEQYNSNIEVSERRLQLEENTIEQINNQSIRLRELTIQGKTGTLNDTDRAAIASEVDQIIKSLDGLMNTKDVQGEFLFSGNKGFTEPYTIDPRTGRYVFNGDDGQRFLQVGPETKVASTDSGFDIFETVPKVSGYVIADINQTSQQIASNEIKDADAFDAFTVERGALQITFNDGAGTFSVTDSQTPPQPVSSDDTPPVVLTNVAFNDGDVIKVAGTELTVGNITADSTITVDAISQHNILNTALDLKAELENADFTTQEGKDKFNERMDHILENLSGIEELNVGTRANIGGRLNTLEQQMSVNTDYELFTTESLSAFEDLDYNEAISQFQLQQTVLQAAYSSFARVQDLNLFNFLR
ncbi:flagellar hook-associated protein FlgL [Neptuniibacter caesariensis]|uniref:Flagellin-like n=1 Tax=Neptuniibacter caesariensis TaxID=207954 RepID=A0A7U8CAH0_NEPCE|nr:flagellar hook-associated protein FlgL [Neptuniibacter caesariensis]EAR63095.1 Flagellin-like [Oceanospirillum sp. MED92] [Neptuniibacter caesariensis]